MTSDDRRLLELLAESEEGATDTLLAGCGISLDFIIELVRAGLASAERAAGKRGEFSRVRITEAGRELLVHANK
jgi:hypothetical protein